MKKPNPAPASKAPILPQKGGAFIVENGALKPDEITLSTQVTAPLGRAAEPDED